MFFFFFFNDTATTEIYTLSLHDALPICPRSFPAITSTVSPFLIRCIAFYPLALQSFGRERDDLGEALLTQFTRHRPKDTSATRVLAFRFQDDRSVVVEANVRAIVAA